MLLYAFLDILIKYIYELLDTIIKYYNISYDDYR